MLSSLSHPNIVSYHNCWLESSFQSQAAPIVSTDVSSSESSSRPLNTQAARFEDITEDMSRVSEESVSFKDDDDEQSSNVSSCQGFFQRTPSRANDDDDLKNVSFTDSESGLSIATKHRASRPKIEECDSDEEPDTLTYVTLYIQLQLCDCTLKHWICERNEELFVNNQECNEIASKIDDSLLLNLFRQILDGVNYIHQKGIIHRDLKVFV